MNDSTPSSDRVLKLAQHLENRPTAESLIEHNILKSFRADPALHEVMQALIRTRREKELGALLKKRRSLQDLIDRNIMVGGPPGAPEVCKARQALLKHFRRHQLNTFLEKRPTLSDVAKRNVLEDTLIWTRLGQHGVPPLARNGATLTCIDDTLFLIGGFCAEGRHSTYDIMCYNVASESWTRPICAGALPSDRFAHSCSVVGKQLVLFGGCSPDGVWLNDVHVLDTEHEQALLPKLDGTKHSWKKKLPPQTMLLWYAPEATGAQPCPRAAHSATVVGTRVYVFGGNDGTRLFNDLHILEVETMGWSKPKVRGMPPSPRAGHGAALVGDHELYIFGGGTAQGPSNSLHILDLETLTWSEPTVLGTPPSPRVGHSLHVLMGPSPMLLVFAGGTMEKLYDDLHVFGCQTRQWSRPSDTGSVPVARTGHSSCLVRDQQSNRESIYFFGGAGPQGQLYNDLYLLDCDFISVASLSEIGSDGDLIKDKLSPSASSVLDGDKYQHGPLWAEKVNMTRERINGLMTDVKKKIDLAQEDALQKEKQLVGSIERSFTELRAEVDALTVFVRTELDNLLGQQHQELF